MRRAPSLFHYWMLLSAVKYAVSYFPPWKALPVIPSILFPIPPLRPGSAAAVSLFLLRDLGFLSVLPHARRTPGFWARNARTGHHSHRPSPFLSAARNWEQFLVLLCVTWHMADLSTVVTLFMSLCLTVSPGKTSPQSLLAAYLAIRFRPSLGAWALGWTLVILFFLLPGPSVSSSPPSPAHNRVVHKLL